MQSPAPLHCARMPMVMVHGIRRHLACKSRCLHFTTCTNPFLAPPSRHRPLVHLSSAPGAKFDGQEIGSPYPIVPHQVTSTERHIESCVSVPWYADESLQADDIRYEEVEQENGKCYNSSMLLTSDQTESARVVGQITRQAMDHALSLLRAGVTTDEIDENVHSHIVSRGAYPSLLYYRGFPKSMASNINEVVTHGIPDSRPIEAGDVITVVLACFRDGIHCKASETVVVGGSVVEKEMPDDSKSRWNRSRRLIRAARDSLDEAIGEANKPGVTMGDIGSAIQTVAESHGYRVVRPLAGHGIGAELQCPPYIAIGSGRDGHDDSSLRLKAGMMLSIAPILVEGHSACARWSSGHTMSTVEGGMSAQFGATVLLTDDGAEVLTGAPARQWSIT